MRWAGNAVSAAALAVALAGCAAGPGSAISSDATFPESPNMRAVQGHSDDVAPLVPEAGDIWAGIMPGPSAPAAAQPQAAETPEQPETTDIWAGVVPKSPDGTPPAATPAVSQPVAGAAPEAPAPTDPTPVAPPEPKVAEGAVVDAAPPATPPEAHDGPAATPQPDSQTTGTPAPPPAQADDAMPLPSGGSAKTVATLVASPDTTAAESAPVPTPAAPAPVTVQLADTASEADARAVWAQLGERAPTLLHDRAPQVVRVEADGQPLWRLRTGGFASQAEAEAFCTQVRAAGSECAVVAGGG
jgi:hypothetical protein